MTFSQLEKEVAALDPAKQRKLSAYLVALRLRRDKAWRAEITRRLDDKSPGAWIPFDALKRRL